MVYLKFLFSGTPAKNWTPILEGRVMGVRHLWTMCMRLDIHCSSSCSHDRSTLHRVPRSIAHTIPKLLGSHRLVFLYMYPHWPAYDYFPFVPSFLWTAFAFNIPSFNTKGSPSITHSISTVVEHTGIQLQQWKLLTPVLSYAALYESILRTRSMAWCSIHLDTRWEWVYSFTALQLSRRWRPPIGGRDSRDTMGASEKRKHVFPPGNPTRPVLSRWWCWQLCRVPNSCVDLTLHHTARYHTFHTAYLGEIFSDHKES